MFGTITAPSGLWLHRSANSRDTSRIVLMPVESRVVIRPDPEADGWLRVEWEAHEGYAYAQWIKRDPPPLKVLPKTSIGRVYLGIAIIVIIMVLGAIWAHGARAGGWGFEMDPVVADVLCAGARVKWCGTDADLAEANKRCSGSPHPFDLPWAGKLALCSDIKQWWIERKPHVGRRSALPILLAQSSWCSGNCGDPGRGSAYDRALAEQRERDQRAGIKCDPIIAHTGRNAGRVEGYICREGK